MLNQGFGGAYGEGDGVGKELEQGMNVKLEYKVTDLGTLSRKDCEKDTTSIFRLSQSLERSTL